MPAEDRENPLLKKGNSDAFFREKYLTKNIRVGFFDPETASVRQTEMYVEGFKAKLKKDTSYKGLWIVSFTLKEL